MSALCYFLLELTSGQVAASDGLPGRVVPGKAHRFIHSRPRGCRLAEPDGETGQTVAPRIVDGTFNSPRGVTAHGDTIYLTEWMIGGRVVRLQPILAV
jgi:hypothetical protein